MDGGFEDIFLPDAFGNSAPALRVGDHIVARGIEPVSRSRDGSPDDIRQQAREVLERTRQVLDAAGASLDNLGRVVGYMPSAGSQREPFYDVWEQLFPEPADKPAFKVLNADLPEGVLLRLDFIAVAGARRTRFDIPKVDARDPTVRLGNLVFTSRLHGTSPETGKTVAGLKAQTRQALSNGIRLVEMAGGTRDDLSQITAFGRDLGYLPELEAELVRQFGTHRPRLNPLVTFIRDELEVMVEITAFIGSAPGR